MCLVYVNVCVFFAFFFLLGLREWMDMKWQTILTNFGYMGNDNCGKWGISFN